MGERDKQWYSRTSSASSLLVALVLVFISCTKFIELHTLHSTHTQHTTSPSPSYHPTLHTHVCALSGQQEKAAKVSRKLLATSSQHSKPTTIIIIYFRNAVGTEEKEKEEEEQQEQEHPTISTFLSKIG